MQLRLLTPRVPSQWISQPVKPLLIRCVTSAKPSVCQSKQCTIMSQWISHPVNPSQTLTEASACQSKQCTIMSRRISRPVNPSLTGWVNSQYVFLANQATPNHELMHITPSEAIADQVGDSCEPVSVPEQAMHHRQTQQLWEAAAIARH